MRKSIEKTWDFLQTRGHEMPRRPDGSPFIPDAMPGQSDKVLGYSYYKMGLERADLSHLSLPRTFFGRSFFKGVRFEETDLSESRMCWNDFEGCDFSGADLSRCDLRASRFTGCRFVGATLVGADLRRSSFHDCDFTGAIMNDAVATEDEYLEIAEGAPQDCLTDDQMDVMAWAPDPGPEPEGG